MADPLHILILEDRPAHAELMVHELRRAGFEPIWQRVETEADYIGSLDPTLDVILADYTLPQFDALRALHLLEERGLHIPFIIVTGTISEEAAVECMKQGAADYLLKDRLTRLGMAVEHAMAQARAQREKAQAEEALRRSEDQYRSIVENAIEGIFQSTPEGRFLNANPAMARMYGYESPEELVATVTNVQCLYVDPNRRSEFKRLIEERGFVRGFEAQVYRKDGIVIWASVNARAVRDGRGAILYYEGSQEDITEQKRAEERLQQQFSRINLLNHIVRAVAERQDIESIFRVMLGQLEYHLPIDYGGVLLLDLETDTITIVARGPKSQPIANGLGLDEGKAIPIGHTAWGPCAKGEVVYLPDLSQVDAPAPRELAQTGIRSALGVPLMVENKALGILVAARREVDGFSGQELEFLQMLSEHIALAAHHARLHSDLKQAYDELRRTQRAIMLQERLRALGQMASGIVHDINNALSPIFGFSDLLLVTEPNLSDRAKDYLKMIHTASADIAHIVAQMREFYRQREQQETLFPVSLSQLAEQVIDLTRPRWKDIPQKQGIAIEINTDLPDNLPLVRGIESEIREAITNLIFNAVDAMPGGGTVTIRTQAAVTHAFLEVSDTGVGMDEETRQRCLEPFFSTKGERGTGLGLSMVFGVMQRHEGDIQIESALGKGTMVRLIFPVDLPGTSPRVRPEMEGERIREPLRVLCIDDDPLLRRLMKEMLESGGHRVEVADGGQAGLDAFHAADERGEPFDVVITDLGMPHMDGRTVAQAVKRRSPSTPVILLTGWGARLGAEGDLPMEVDVVLSKPPKVNQVREALQRVMPRKPGSPR